MTDPDTEHANASQKPQVFYAKHMEPGVCFYDGKDGGDMVLVECEDMKKFMPSMQGCPVYVLHQKVDFAKLEDEADGYISDCFYNELDGWLWCKFVAVTDEAARAIAQGWKVSNAYIPLEWTGKGVYHNVDYNRKIVNAKFTHMAIVPDPRYENADILTPEQFKAYNEKARAKLDELHNSKTTIKGTIIMKIFRSKKEEIKNEIENPDEVHIELENGKTVNLGAAIKHFEEMQNAKKNADDDKKDDDEKKEKMNMDSMVKCNGEDMTAAEFMNRYNAMVKENAEDEEKEKKEKENAEADEKKEAEEKKNSADKKKAGEKNFRELQNARSSAKRPVIETTMDKVARGKKMFGSGK